MTPSHRQLTVARKRLQKSRARPTEASQGQQPNAQRVADQVAEAWLGNMVSRPPLAFQRLYGVLHGR